MSLRSHNGACEPTWHSCADCDSEWAARRCRERRRSRLRQGDGRLSERLSEATFEKDQLSESVLGTNQLIKDGWGPATKNQVPSNHLTSCHQPLTNMFAYNDCRSPSCCHRFLDKIDSSPFSMVRSFSFLVLLFTTLWKLTPTESYTFHFLPSFCRLNGRIRIVTSQYALCNTTSEMDLDIPRPTVNGGYTHTSVSRHKISLANRGKVPWNKGMNRSDEVKAKIAEGVRRKNRERFLERLASLNVTEEEWKQQQVDAKTAQREERLARRTANGGYSPTEETRRKISQVLKEKFATGQLTRRSVDPDKVRKGFTHSEETRAKISESLRRRWATDDRYRASMKRAKSLVTSKEEVRQKISQTLREKWQDPEFREAMLEKMANSTRRRVAASGAHRMKYDIDHRQRISEAMKEKWQDEAYRSKTLEAIARKRQAKIAHRPQRQQQPKKCASKSLAPPDSTGLPRGFDLRRAPPETVRASVSSAAVRAISSRVDGLRGVATAALKPLEPKAVVPMPKHRTTADGTGKGDFPVTRTSSRTKPTAHVDALESAASPENDGESSVTSPSTKKKMESRNGDMARLKLERRDLYELLYGDDDEDEGGDGDDNDDDDYLAVSVDDDDTTESYHDASNRRPVQSRTPLHEGRDGRGGIVFPDEDLSQFDPYGLRDY